MSHLSMTRSEREAFLAGLHVGILAVEGGDGRPPLTAPIWYGYEPGGDVFFVIGRTSQKARRLTAAGRASVCAQSEDAPYKYVTVEGPVAITDGVEPEQRRALAHRYLPAALADGYIAATADTEADTVTVHLTPRRWLTTDYAKQFG